MTVDQDRLWTACPTTARPCSRALGAAAARSIRRCSPSEITPCSPTVAGAVLDGRAVPAGAGRDQRADRVRCSRSASTARSTPASRSRRSPCRATRTARSPRTCSATPARSPRRTRGRPEAHRRRHDRASAGSRSSTTACCAASTASSTCSSTRRATRSAPTCSVAGQQGDTLVTSIDASVQQLAEQSLAQQIADSRKAGKPATVRRGRRDGPAAPAGCSRWRATRPTTRSCSSAASPTPTTAS